MKSRRVTLIGCGRSRERYYNAEGYADPTAGSAIARADAFYRSKARRKPGKGEDNQRQDSPGIADGKRQGRHPIHREKR